MVNRISSEDAMTTPTPRTDAAKSTAAACCGEPEESFQWVTADFSRQLERDLTAANEELERVRDKCNEHYMALAAAQEARQRAEALAERYETRLFKLGAMDDAPCFKCGYNGAGYYQPHIHDCAAKHHAAREGK